MFRNFFNLITNMGAVGHTKMVLIVRTDLKMSQGKIAGQCAHAAVILYSSANNSITRNKYLSAWMLSGQPKIVLRINSEKSMRELYEQAKRNNLNASLVCDAGRTQLCSGTVTVLGIGPNNSSDIDEITKHLKLL